MTTRYFAAFISVLACHVYSLPAATVVSPSGDISLTLNTAGGLTYSVTAYGATVITSSQIRLATTAWTNIGASVSMSNITTHSSNSIWNPVVPGRRSVIRDHYNEIACTLTGIGAGVPGFVVRARVYDDGVAFKCEFSAQLGNTNVQAMTEATEFAFTSDARCWAADYGSYVSHQEAKFEEKKLSGIANYAFVGFPLLVELNTNLYIAISEADLTDHSGMYLKRKTGNAGQPVTLVNHLSAGVTSSLPHSTPWRMVMIARQPVKFLENDMLLNLNAPCAITNTSWIQPGMMAWDHWWSDDVQMDTGTIKQYIKLAADMGWPYQLIDWTWYGTYDTPSADITQTTPNVNMPEVLAYAASNNVRCWLWLYWTDADRGDAYLDAFALYEQWGIAGVKIDFMQREDQWMVNWYDKIVKKAAEHHLMVDFHGAYKPTGSRRTWPNLLTREGVLGNEWNKGTPWIDPEHKATLAFTRNLLGEMDFTPGGFRNRTQSQFIATRPTQVQGTRCQELSLFVIYESPLISVCDMPSAYSNAPGADFLKLVPTTWDETVGIDGRIDDYMVVAKRDGTNWYLAAMTDWDARALTVPLGFLGTGTYHVTIWRDADDANVNPENLIKETNTVTSSNSLYLYLAPGGGTVMRFVPTAGTNAPSKPAPSTWTAYNDLSWGGGQLSSRISAMGPAGSMSGPLRDYATGDSLPIQVTMTGSSSSFSGNSSNPPGASDGDQVFGGKIDCVGYANCSTGTISIRFDGLTPGQPHSFVLFGSRGIASYTYRWTDIQIMDATGFLNNSSSGATILTNAMPADTARILAANMDGKVWRFDNILPAADGHITFVATPGGSSSTSAYLNAFMLSAGDGSAVSNPATSGWSGYNDVGWQGGQLQESISTFSPAGTTSGMLIKQSDGTTLPIQAAFSGSASFSGNPANLTGDSPAQQLFTNIVSLDGYVTWSSGTLTLTLSELDPAETYSFAMFGSRGQTNYTYRWTDVRIADVDGFVNNSSPGANRSTVSMPEDQTRILAANTQGLLWRYDNIQPGSDGTIVITATAGGSSSTGGYINAFMLTTEDGMTVPDSWKLGYFGTTNVNMELDSDSDGLVNWQEYIAGTSPINGLSLPGISGISMTGGSVLFSINSVTQRTYYVDYRSNLSAATWIPYATVSGNGSMLTISNTANEGTRYYRYRVALP